jgi:hypothetical protein
MSDLYDGEIASMDERTLLLGHIGECESCALEYRRLGETLRLCGRLSGIVSAPDGLPAMTMRKIMSGKKRRLFMKSLPAMAASLLVIAGAGLFNAGIIGVHGRGGVAGVFSRSQVNDSERVIDIIRKHNAAIALVTDEYVEGTVPVSSFDQLRRALGSRKAAYMPVGEDESGRDIQWGNAIEEVGLGEGRGQGELAPLTGPSGSGVKYIRFRVFR